MRIITGKYGRRRFDVPSNITARPTTDFARENIFNVLNGLINIEGISALDLFAGTGAISLELLSRGASSVTSVEKAATQYNFMRRTAATLDDPAWHIVRGDVFKYIATCGRRFDLVFADPPYNLENFGDIPGAILDADIINQGGLMIIEHSRAYDFSHLAGYIDHRTYGSVNFTICRIGQQ